MTPALAWPHRQADWRGILAHAGGCRHRQHNLAKRISPSGLANASLRHINIS